MKLLKLIWFSLFLVLNFFLCASTTCPAPAPSAADFQNLDENNVIISWDEVLGANSYLITAHDPDGVLIDQEITSFTNHIISSLEDGLEYTIRISSSYCDIGPFGNPLQFKVKNSIIIIDDIVQIGCPGGTSTTTTAANGSSSSISFSENDKNCYFIHVETTSMNPNISFDLSLSVNEKGELVLGDYINNPPEFELENTGPVLMASYHSPDIIGGIPIFNLSAPAKDGNITAMFDWKQDVILTITSCHNCNSGTSGLTPLVSYDESPATPLVIYPNPGKDQMNIELSDRGSMQILDITGRKWYNGSFTSKKNNLSISINNWPSGTYIIYYYKGDRVPEIQYFLKL